jgi:hypothetical protein
MNKIMKLLVNQTLIFRNVEKARIITSDDIKDKSITEVKKIVKAILDELQQTSINDEAGMIEVFNSCEGIADKLDKKVILSDETLQIALLYKWQCRIVKNVAIHFLKPKQTEL